MKKLLLCLIGTGLLAVGGSSAFSAEVPVSVTVDSSNPQPAIPDDFAGLSYETKREMPDEQGKYYFNPDNKALATMFQTLGIKNLRIGGNTVDSPKVTIPKNEDIDALFGFAKAANAKVIYSFRVHNGNPDGSAEQAKYIADKYADSLICYSIGNEPDVFVHSYKAYLGMWRPVYDAINKSVPDAKFCGPSLTSNGVHWAADFAKEFGPSGKFVYITQHQYAGGAGGKVTDPVAGRDAMLSPAWQQIYQKYYDEFVPGVKAANMPYRLEEGNNFYNGGAKDVSDTFASAMWGLDYLYFWAAHGSQGINFHNGDQVAAGQELAPCRYASFTTVDDGYFAHPLAYAVKIFNLGSKGQIVDTKLVPDDSAKDINIVSYAVLGADKNLYVTLINKEHGDSGRSADVTINAGAYTKGSSIALVPPNGDVAAKDGLTLGGNPINHDGTWTEAWTPLDTVPAGGQLHVKVPACSVLLVKLTGN